MNDTALPTRDQLSSTYLQQLQALAVEITLAMDAIAANELSGFQESVAKQEMLCANLVQMANAVSNGSRSSGQQLLASDDSAVDLKIQAASEAVRELNLQYAALLKHSGRSVALLASLCRSHIGQLEGVRGTTLKHQTWSCEM
jgi:hypothetical protein